MPFSGRVPSMVPGSGQGCGRGGSDGSGWHVHGSGKGVRRVHAVALGGGLVLAMGFAGIALASSANRPPTPPPAQGEITAITGGVLTIKGPGSKTETVDTTSATVVRSGPGLQGKASSVSALKVGEGVAVFGNHSGNALEATAIWEMPAMPGVPGLPLGRHAPKAPLNVQSTSK